MDDLLLFNNSPGNAVAVYRGLQVSTKRFFLLLIRTVGESKKEYHED